MKTFVRILSVVVVALCILGILAAAAGIFGVWRANGPVTSALVNTVTGLQAVVGGIDEGLDRLTLRLDAASDSVALVEDTVTVAGDTLAQSTPVLELLTRIFGDQLLPSVSAGMETARGLGESALAINSTLETVNAIPGISVPTLSPELSALAQDLAGLESQVNQATQEIQGMKLAAAESVVTPVTDRTARMQARLDSIAARASDASARIGETEAGLAQLRERLPLVIDLASIVATLILGWLLLAQLSLLVHAWGRFSAASGTHRAPPMAAEGDATTTSP